MAAIAECIKTGEGSICTDHCPLNKNCFPEKPNSPCDSCGVALIENIVCSETACYLTCEKWKEWRHQ